MRAHLYILSGLMLAGAGLACDTSSDADPRHASCLRLNEGDCLPEAENPGPPGETCGYRTETQSSWGEECEADAPACFRDDHFLDMFPEGLHVGCGEYTANVLNPEAIELALTTSGTPRALLKTEAVVYDGDDDPSVGTSLFGDVVALGLNVGFDALPGFTPGQPSTPLAELVVAEGPCTGLTVAHVLEEANLLLGGCPSALTLADVTTCVTAINTSFAQQPMGCDRDDDDDNNNNKKKINDECAEAAPVCSALLKSP